MSRDLVVGLRALLLWLAVGLVALAVTRVLAPTVSSTVRRGGAAGFEDLLTATCSAALLVATGWCWLVITSELVATAGRTRPRLRAPLPLRRLVAVACGVGVLATSAPAYAAPADPGPAVSGRAVVVGLPLPTRPLGEPAPPGQGRSEVAPRPVLTPRIAPGTGDLTGGDRPTVVVRAGDSLWTIADRALPDDADLAETDRAWRALWRANRDVIGGDPDLIQPGTTLHLTDPKEPR